MNPYGINPTAVDRDLLDAHNSGVLRARSAYAARMTELDPVTAAPVYDRRVEHALANQRYRARKKAQS